MGGARAEMGGARAEMGGARAEMGGARAYDYGQPTHQVCSTGLYIWPPQYEVQGWCCHLCTCAYILVLCKYGAVFVFAEVSIFKKQLHT